jgi:hypothetical protein
VNLYFASKVSALAEQSEHREIVAIIHTPLCHRMR